MMTIANIRTMLSLSILGYCIYKEMLENASIIKHIPLLIIAALFHTTGIAALLIYLTYTTLTGILILAKSTRSQSIPNIILLPLGIISGGYYLQRALTKGQNYLRYSTEGTGYFYGWEMGISFIVITLTLLLITVIMTSLTKRTYQWPHLEKQFIFFMICFSVLDALLFLFEFNIALRLNWLLTILDMPLFALIFSKQSLISHKKFLVLKYILCTSSIVILGIVCARGHLCSLKFFE